MHLWRPGELAPAISQAEERISQARDYVALLSPDFLSSPLCRRERELAMCREQNLRLRYPDMNFIHVLLVHDTGVFPNGFPPRAEWLDITDQRHLDSRLEQLDARLRAAPGTLDSAAARSGQGSVHFRDRSDELDVVIRGLTNFGGPHFWLVIAPPQFGKTWFLDRLGATLLLGERDPWTARLVDMRGQSAEACTDVGLLLRCLFGPDSPTTSERNTYFYIAQKIIDSGQRHLYMIDSAELLDEDTARTLRVFLSEIYRIVVEAGLPQARFTVVVASRRENEWRGITPDPRLSILSLTEFDVNVVRDAMKTLADEMDRTFESSRLMRDASRIYRLSEGLPALLVRSIAWVEQVQWMGMERIESEQIFREIVRPYIQNVLLAHDSLFPPGRGRFPSPTSPTSREPEYALEQACVRWRHIACSRNLTCGTIMRWTPICRPV